MTPREIIAARLAELVDAARKLPPDGVVAADRLAAAPERWATARRMTIRPSTGWPAELPLPLTAGEALARVEAGAPGILDELDGEISRMVEALVAPDLRAVVDLEAVSRAWPWPDRQEYARDRALALLTAHALNRWPAWAGYPPIAYGKDREIAEWAAERLTLHAPDYGPELHRWRATLGVWGDVTFTDVTSPLILTLYEGGRRWPAQGILLLWAAECEARASAYALDAAADVRAELAHLVDARDPSPEIFAALDVATEGDPLAAGVDASTRGGWAGALLTLAQGVAGDVLALPEPTAEDDARAAAAAAAGVVADALAKLGTAGRERADTVRQRAAKRAADLLAGELLAGELWALWRGTSPPRWIEALARVLWADRWRPERERERDRPRELTPALPVDVHTAIARGLSVWTVEPREDGADVLLSRDGARLADLAPAGLPDALRPERLTAAELRSVDTHRLLLWYLRTLREREVADEYDWRVIKVEGRWERLAELVDGDRDKLRKIVPYLARLPIPGPPGTEPGNLYAFDPGAPSVGQRQGWFALTAGTLLHPGALHARHRWDRATIPVPDLPPMARVVSSRANEHGQLATLRLYTVRRLQSAGAELLTEGGAKIHGSAWLEDLAAVGLREPIARVDRVVDAWLTGGDDAGPFLVRAGRDRYHLHPDHKGARDYLDEGARRSKEGAERAKRARSQGNKQGGKRGK